MPIVVNGIEITDHAVHAEMQYHPAGSLEQAREAAARALVVRELLLQAAARLGIEEVEPHADPETGRRETHEEAVIRTLIEREVKIPVPDESACRRYYENNRRRFRTGDLFEAAHILFLVDPNDEEATSRARQKADAALRRLIEDPGCFAEVARQLSACPSAARGGSLGRIKRGQTAPELEAVLGELEEGAIHPSPVKTRFGYHLLRLDRRVCGRELPFEAVKEHIAAYLREHVWRRAVSQYVQLLVGQACIQGLELQGSESPLVQ